MTDPANASASTDMVLAQERIGSGASVIASRWFEYGLSGAAVRNDLIDLVDRDRWQAIHEVEQEVLRLAHGFKSLGWWLGDVMNHADWLFGDEAASQVLPDLMALGYEEQTVRNMKSVAKAIPRERRRTRLTYSHHAEVSSLSPGEQDLWLDRAEQAQMSVHSLRSQVRPYRKRPKGVTDVGKPGDMAYQDAVKALLIAERRIDIAREAAKTVRRLLDERATCPELGKAFEHVWFALVGPVPDVVAEDRDES